MRISDWSSDVCSSDLHEKLLRQRQHDAPLAHIGILRLVDQDMVGALVELEAHPFAEAADAQQRARKRDEIVEIGQPRLALGECIGLGKAAPQRPRSEEHTSELQSLMRISYAVFCLKKKIQKTPTNKPEH